MKATFAPTLIFACMCFAIAIAHRSALLPHVQENGDSLCPQHIGAPCPYHFNNTMPDYKEGSSVIIPPTVKTEMQRLADLYAGMIVVNQPPGYNSTSGDDYSVYDGHSGHALLFLRLAKLAHNAELRHMHLNQAQRYIEKALEYVPIADPNACSFQAGAVGTHALAAVIAHQLGDEQQSQQFVDLVKQRFVSYKQNSCPDSLIGGLAGLIYTGIWLNNALPSHPIANASLLEVAQVLINHGAALGDNKYLAYTLNNVKFIGAAEGAAGVLHVLMEVPGLMDDARAKGLIKATLDSFISQQLPDGNFPVPGDWNPANTDNLVQWCEGAPGFIDVLLRGFEIFGVQAYRTAADRATDVVWERGLLTKGMLLCHGVSGNAYCLLQHYKRTGDPKSLYRAIKFAEWTLDVAHVEAMRVPDEPFSMYAGNWAGATFIYSDLINGAHEASMPAYEFNI
eukprot:TRINITY_DN3146_c0_g1_i1.p1 TRINITY_DN3146_c0_g1~~TRINITY_DN3146_c0_g1_i1.p1  ORF type:complete len:482 (-),score=106.65 TRINITY_DN3146_c0_g1_i1:48-1403(-)